MDITLTKEKLFDRRVKNGFSIKGELFHGDKKAQEKRTENVKNSKGIPYKFLVSAPKGGLWKNSEAYHKLWSQAEDNLRNIKKLIDRKVNLNQFPDDYYDLIQRTVIDLTRKRLEQMDFTSEFTNEITNVNFSKSINLREFIPFAGVFEEHKGSGDNVPMLQQKTGALGSVDVILYALGHARSLEDELYNLDIYSLQKVNEAVSRAHKALRNNLCFNPLIALTAAAGWNVSQVVAADATGATYDVRLYLTIRNALRLLYGLLDPQTDQEIDALRVTLLVRNNVIEWDLQRVINGQLEKFGTPVENRAKLAIDEIWKYKGDSITVGPKTTTYAGVPEGTAYLFVTGPDGAPTYTLNKRQLTQEVGRGDVLQLARERRAWYSGQAEYREEFLGSSSATLGAADGYGFVVTINLPEPDGET